MKKLNYFFLIVMLVYSAIGCKKDGIKNEDEPEQEQETVNIMKIGDDSFPIAGTVRKYTNLTDYQTEQQIVVFSEHLVYDTTYREVVPSEEGGGYGVRFILCYNDSTINGEYFYPAESADSLKYAAYSSAGFLSSQQSVNYMFDDGKITVNQISENDFNLDFSFNGTDGRIFSGHYEGAFINY